MNLFTETGGYRSEKFIFRLSPDERKFLREEARKRGVRVVTLLRLCIRETCLDAPEKQVHPDHRLDQDQGP